MIITQPCFLSVILFFILQQCFLTIQTTVESVITVKSQYSVNNTLDLIEQDIKQQGGIVFARIDQKKAAEEAGLFNQLDDAELIIFGNPKVGTQLMVENGAVSIELPLRISCWKRNESVFLSATNPAALEIPYNLSSKKEVLQKMSDNLVQMINKYAIIDNGNNSNILALTTHLCIFCILFLFFLSF